MIKLVSESNGKDYPSTATVAELVIYWFLRHYEATEGKAYKMKSQTRLAEDAGVSQSVISGLINKKPDWLQMETTETILTVKPNTDPNTET